MARRSDPGMSTNTSFEIWELSVCREINQIMLLYQLKSAYIFTMTLSSCPIVAAGEY